MKLKHYIVTSLIIIFSFFIPICTVSAAPAKKLTLPEKSGCAKAIACLQTQFYLYYSQKNVGLKLIPPQPCSCAQHNCHLFFQGGGSKGGKLAFSKKAGFTTLKAQPKTPAKKTISSMTEEEWQQKQKKTVETVLHLAEIGTRYKAYRCGLYVPGYGVCYMKLTQTQMPADPASKPAEEAGPYLADIAELFEITKTLITKSTLSKTDSIAYHSRFINAVYLRLVDYKLANKIAISSPKSLFAYRKLVKEIISYANGAIENAKDNVKKENDKEDPLKKSTKDTDKVDIWVSSDTERFSQGRLSVSKVSGEGMIIPDKLIVLYQRHPELMREGEKVMADRLFEVFEEARVLNDYFDKYELAVGLECGTQLLFAKYPIKQLEKLKRGDMKYFKYSHF